MTTQETWQTLVETIDNFELEQDLYKKLETCMNHKYLFCLHTHYYKPQSSLALQSSIIKGYTNSPWLNFKLVNKRWELVRGTRGHSKQVINKHRKDLAKAMTKIGIK